MYLNPFLSNLSSSRKVWLVSACAVAIQGTIFLDNMGVKAYFTKSLITSQTFFQ